MVTITAFKDNFNSICQEQIWKVLENKADLAKQEQDKTEEENKDKPNRFRDEHLIQKNVTADPFVTYILTNIENEQQIKEIHNNLNSVTQKTLEEFKKQEFYNNFSEIYGLNIGINTIYANTKILSEYYDTLTKDLGLTFVDGWKDNPDSKYREYLAETAKENLVYIIDAKNGDITISKPTEDTCVNWQGNVYVDGKPEL